MLNIYTGIGKDHHHLHSWQHNMSKDKNYVGLILVDDTGMSADDLKCISDSRAYIKRSWLPKEMRIIRPDMGYTRDSKPRRLNLHLDGANVILQQWWG